MKFGHSRKNINDSDLELKEVKDPQRKVIGSSLRKKLRIQRAIPVKRKKHHPESDKRIKIEVVHILSGLHEKEGGVTQKENNGKKSVEQTQGHEKTGTNRDRINRPHPTLGKWFYPFEPLIMKVVSGMRVFPEVSQGE
jgi:hypothetical protein